MARLKNKQKRKKPLVHRLIHTVLGMMVVVALFIAFALYRVIFAPNVNAPAGKMTVLFIPTGSTYEDVVDSLKSKQMLVRLSTFEWLAARKNYPGLVKPGRYLVTSGMNNLQLVNLLRSGEQQPVKVTFTNIRSVEQLCGVVSRQIEADSSAICRLLTDEAFLQKYGLDRYTALCLFIPNTYEFYWNTSAEQFIERMKAESDRFWNKERMDQAFFIGLSTTQVITLASIVDKETNKNDEKPKIAGVYMNRLIRGWPLQADPTLVYASGDFGTTRILNEHKKIDSPYNTYAHKGLPPGPICIPSIASIDAVLKYQKHDYMYFVARSDLSGYHVFSKTLFEHNKHARNYRQAVKEANKNS